MRIVVLTFNQGRCSSRNKLNRQEMHHNLTHLRKAWKDPDMLVVSTQETWGDVVLSTLRGTFVDYITLFSTWMYQPSLGYMQLAILVRPSCAGAVVVDPVHSGYSRCALAKGAVFITLDVNGRHRLQFFGVHLPAAVNRPHDRNDCLKRLLQRYRVPDATVVVAGDMNYRTTDGKLQTDQLTQALRDGGLRDVDLVESRVDFAQTCRLIEGRLSQLQYDKRRSPSWCDRILRSTNNRKLRAGKYAATDLCTQSDHLAVWQVFELDGDDAPRRQATPRHRTTRCNANRP